ncbi:MAG: hypothetical protein ACHBNF_11510 [Chromatiales bacterium]
MIARAGHPIAILSEFKPDRYKIAQPGSMEGEAWVAEDFNASLDELFDAFEKTA